MISYSVSYRLQYFSVEHFKQTCERINRNTVGLYLPHHLNIKYTRIFSIIFLGGLLNRKTNKRKRAKNKLIVFAPPLFFLFLRSYLGKTTQFTDTKRGKRLQCSQATTKVRRTLPLSLTMPLHSTLTPQASPSPPPPSLPTLHFRPLVLSSCYCLVLTSTVLRWRAARWSLFLTGY